MQRSTWLPSFYPYCIIITITIVLITGGARQSLTCVLLLVVRKTSTVGLSNLWYTIFVPYTISMIWCQTYDTLHGDTHDIVSNIQYTIFVPYTISMIWCQTYDTHMIHYTAGDTHNIVSNLWYTTYHIIYGVVTTQNKILTNQLYQIYLFEKLYL